MISNNEAINSLKDLPREEVKRDLYFLLENNFSKPQIGLRIISEKTNISKKTLQRLLEGQGKPNQQTVMRFYKYYFSSVSDENLSIQHQWIKSFFMEKMQEHYGQVNSLLERRLEENSVFRAIYINSKVGAVSRKKIRSLYGLYGEKILNEMEELGLLKLTERDLFKGTDVVIAKTPKALKRIIQELNEDHLDENSLSSINQNSAFYFCEKVNEDAFQMLLEVFEEMKKALKNILSDEKNLGDRPVFVTSTFDSLKF